MVLSMSLARSIPPMRADEQLGRTDGMHAFELQNVSSYRTRAPVALPRGSLLPVVEKIGVLAQNRSKPAQPKIDQILTQGKRPFAM